MSRLPRKAATEIAPTVDSLRVQAQFASNASTTPELSMHSRLIRTIASVVDCTDDIMIRLQSCAAVEMISTQRSRSFQCYVREGRYTFLATDVCGVYQYGNYVSTFWHDQDRYGSFSSTNSHFGPSDWHVLPATPTSRSSQRQFSRSNGSNASRVAVRKSKMTT